MKTSTENKKLALITGASSGIGLELARVMAENGYDLVVNSASEAINECAADLRNLGVDVTPLKADLATREGVDELYDCVRELGRPLDILSLNAGVGVGGEFVENGIEAELRLINLNVTNLVYATKLFLKDMIARNEGKILFTSSIGADLPAPFLAVYGASKAFVQSFAEALRVELSETDRDITITALQPGPTDTNFFARADMLTTKVAQDSKDDPRMVAEAGFKALMKGKDHVVAGLKNKIMDKASQIMSDPMKAKVHSSLTKPDELKH